MLSKSSARFIENKRDIELLWHIYTDQPGSGKNKKQKQDVVARSAIIFISACWESYVEDIASEAFDIMLSKAKSPDIFPWRVRILASRSLKENKDERAVWKLAGNGWHQILQLHREDLISRWLGEFNTPKSKQVISLFKDLIGIPDITSNWIWQTMSSNEACEKLDKYITMRGNIAHRAKHDETVYKSSGKNFLALVALLVSKIDESVYVHLLDATGVSPW